MTHWDLAESRNLVKVQYGPEQFELVRQSIGSTVNRIEYARYHYDEAIKLLDEHIGKLSASGDLVILNLGAGEEFQQSIFYQHIFEISAHVTACVQSLHALGDTFAHVVYYALGFNRRTPPLKERQICVSTVQNKLGESPKHNNLLKIFGSLISADDFVYLHALVNHSKHRSLIKPLLWVDMTGENLDPYTVQFQAFNYDHKPHPIRLIRPYVKSEFERQSKLVVDAGNELNLILKAELVV